MKNVFDSVAFRAPQLNKFDLSHDKKLSTRFGHLVPVFVKEVLPGERLRVSSEVFMRFAPLVAPVMHEMNCYVHYFYTPNRILWSAWEQFITGGEDGTAAPVWPHYQYNTASRAIFDRLGGLADFIGWPADGDLASPVQPESEQHINALPFRAYQKIWYEYYRDQNMSTAVVINDSSGTQTLPQTAIDCQLRARAWEKDYFTSALPWAQRGGQVTLPFEASEITYKLPSDPIAFSDSAGLIPAPPGAVSVAAGGELESAGLGGTEFAIRNIESISGASVTIAELRRSARLQEWLEKNAVGGSRYVEQLAVHWNVRSSDARLQRPEYLGGGKTRVQVSEVLQTSESNSTPQGSMAGHGVAYGSSNQFSRRFEEHGWVIGIMSVLPRTAYQQGIPRYLSMRSDKLDYPWPEFAQIGEQEVLNKELFYDRGETDDANEQTFGYQSRYSEHKYIPSTVHGEFKDAQSYWHVGRIFASRPSLNLAFTTVDPDADGIERIFAVQDDTANLWCHVYNHASAILPLPYYGTPML